MPAVLAAFALVLAGLGGASIGGTTTAEAAEQVTFQLSGVPSAVFGQKVTLDVTWYHGTAPVTGRVNLQRLEGGSWRHVRQFGVTNGQASTVITPGGSNSYRLRASSASSPSGVSTAHPRGTSNTYSVSVQSNGLRAASPELSGPSSVVFGTWARMRVDWFAGNRPVTGRVNLQRVGSDGRWSHIRQLAVVDGVAEFVTTPGRTSLYRLRVSSVSAPSGVWTSHPSGTSNERAVVVQPKPVASGFTIRGAGWGHGVGMSQYGAYGMAREGASAAQILQHFYSGTALGLGPSSDPEVRVQVRSTTGSVTVRNSGGSARIKVGGSVVATVPAGSDIVLTPVSSGVRVAVDGQSWQTASTGSRIAIEWASTRYYQPTSSIDVNVSVSGAHRYRHGRLEAKGINGAVNLVNVVRLSDEYVYGIAEMPSSWPAAALQAQAIAARTYALTNMGSTSASCDCHLYSDTRSQVFTGWDKENQTVYGRYWRAAVDATVVDGRGQLVTRNGTPVTTYYFSSSGGRTQNSEDVWSSALPHLRSVSDSWSLDPAINPNASWTATVSQSAMARAFGLADVVRVQVVGRTDGNGAALVRATSSTGSTATLTGERFRSRLGLRATWITSIS